MPFAHKCICNKYVADLSLLDVIESVDAVCCMCFSFERLYEYHFTVLFPASICT